MAVRLALAVVASAMLACSRGAEPWNLLLVTLDTTRADHIGAYGEARALTPALDGLAREGLLYERCYATAPLTLPSHASMLTGLHPPRHGVRANDQQLPNETTTLAELLRAHGYGTAAVVASFVLNRSFGLAQGFDHYDDDLAEGATPNPHGYTERSAQAVTEAALEWLAADREQPWFLWLHYFDPHAPYLPARAPSASFRTPYAAEIESVDSQLARVLTSLELSGALRRTLVVVTADHGEALREHGELTHGLFAYDSTLRVPLIVRFPDGRQAGTTLSQPVSLSDLTPSMLAWLELPVPDGLDGQPLPTRDAPQPSGEERVVYFENHGPAHHFGWSPQWGIVAGDFKYIHAPSPELYNLRRDPSEVRNLYPADDERAKHWRRRFEGEMEALDAAPRSGAIAAELGDADRQRLEALGYGVAGERVDALALWRDPTGLDPKHQLATYRDLQLALKVIADGHASEGVDILAKVLASDDPRNRRAILMLLELLVDEAAGERAIEALEAVARRGSGDATLDHAVREGLRQVRERRRTSQLGVHGTAAGVQ